MRTRQKDISVSLGVFTIAVSSMVIAGYFLHIPIIRSVLPGAVSMKFNSAVCFALLGIALLFPAQNRKSKRLVLLCSLVVAAIALLTIFEYVFHWSMGIDQLLWQDDAAKDSLFPGRPSLPASINFLAIALIVILRAQQRTGFLAWAASWMVFLFSFLSFLGYVFGIPYLDTVPTLAQMALPTSVLFMLLSAGMYYLGEMEYLVISFRKKMFAGFLLIMLVFGLVLFIYNENDQRFISTSKWVEHTGEVIQQSEETMFAITAVESAVRGYLVTKSESFLPSLNEEQSAVSLHLQKLAFLTRDNPQQRQRIKTLGRLVEERFKQFRASVQTNNRLVYSSPGSQEIVAGGSGTMTEIRLLTAIIQQEEKALLEERKADNLRSIGNTKHIIYFFGFVMLVILVVLLALIVRNINARIRAEEETKLLNTTLENRVMERTEELMRAESKFHYTLDNMMEGAQIIDFNWKYIYVNDALLKYAHFTRDELIGKTVMERYPGIEKAPVFANFEACMYERKQVHIENEFFFPDGSFGWFELSFQPIPDGIFILSVDITERKRSELAINALNADIAKREERFRSIIESSIDLIALLNADAVPLYVSPSAIRITGWSRDEMQQPRDLAEQVHPGDLEAFTKAWAACLATPGQPIATVFRSLHKKGHYIWLEGSLTNLLHEEAVGAIVANLQDVSLRKASEEKLKRSEWTYRIIASSIPGSVICLLDTDLRYYLVEGDMLSQLGYVKEALVGFTVQEALTPERYAALEPYFKRVLAGETFLLEEARKHYDTLARYIPLKTDEGQVYAVMIVVFDITQLKNAQRSLAELNQQLEDRIIERTEQLASANKELESFSYSVSHDLRAPLRGIDGWSLALLEDYGDQLDEKAHKYLGRVRTETQRMGELIDDLLKLSRVSRTELRIADVNISQQVMEICARLREENPGRVFDFVIGPGLHTMADANLMEIMLTNLLSNAGKFTSRVSPSRIEFGSKVIEGKSVFFLRDNGVGFNMDNAKNLFGAFQRMHRQSEFPGTGIGLATVQRIVHLHHGTIWAEAAVNTGATFYFVLP